MSLSDDIEAKDLAISLFWTSEYVQANKIKPELSLYVTENGRKGLKGTIDYYTGKINTARHDNFSRILDDLLHDKVYFVKDVLK